MKYNDNTIESQTGGGSEYLYPHMAKIKGYIAAVQKMGGTENGKTYAEEIYKDTFRLLQKCGCSDLVNPQLLENYAHTMARHIQCEQILSQTGLLAKQPVTGEPIANPLVKVSLDYLNSANKFWAQIYKIIEDFAI